MPAIGDADRTVHQYRNAHFALRWRIDDGVLNQIAQRVFNRIDLSGNPDRLVRPVETDHAPLPNRPRRQTTNGACRESVEFDNILRRWHGVEPRDAEQLLDQAVHPRRIATEELHGWTVRELVKLCRQDRKWRAQLMRGIGGELALKDQAAFEPVERLVEASDQRQQLAR